MAEKTRYMVDITEGEYSERWQTFYVVDAETPLRAAKRAALEATTKTRAGKLAEIPKEERYGAPALTFAVPRARTRSWAAKWQDPFVEVSPFKVLDDSYLETIFPPEVQA